MSKKVVDNLDIYLSTICRPNGIPSCHQILPKLYGEVALGMAY